MTLINDLKNLCKEISGNVVTIGVDYKTVLDELDKNEKIVNLYSMQFNGKKRSKKKEKGKKRDKIVSIKKIRKIFKKKKIDYIICNIEDINRFLRTFIRDSVYINKKKLYIYGSKNNIDLELIEKRYNRYNVIINITEYDKDVLIEIDNTKAFNNALKDIFYNIADIFYSIYNAIGDLLIN